MKQGLLSSHITCLKVKDNSFTVETLYLGHLENDNVFKSSRNSWYFSAKGENSEILLTEAELEEIIDWQKKLHDYFVSDEIVPFEPLSFRATGQKS